MMDEKEEACEWIVAFKHNLRKAIFEDYRVTVGDTQTVEHYYESLASLDRELCKVLHVGVNGFYIDDTKGQNYLIKPSIVKLDLPDEVKKAMIVAIKETAKEIADNE